MGRPLTDHIRRRSRAETLAERARLGFARQPAVRWLSPGLLARSAAEVVVSGWFGRFADKREQQRSERQDVFAVEPAPDGELWLDFLSDTGDGWEATATMAWLLAQPSLPGPGGGSLRRGDVLLLGGDQVYPSASAEAYEDRFVGPFAAALPKPAGAPPLPEPAAPAPEAGPQLFALPGNHDWYDGLTAFLRLFCQPGRLGGWRQRQARSYWALRLPHRWWVFAIDIQLDTYIDRAQLDYFACLKVKEGDHILLVTAKPSWVKVTEKPASWRNLTYFVEKVIDAHKARLVLVLTGDLHHYSRYGDANGRAPVWITAGGGGAYTSPTHTLPDPVELPLGKRALNVGLEACYPSAEQSCKRRKGVFRLPFTNPSFGCLMGTVYAAFAVALLGALNGGPRGLVEEATASGMLGSAASGGTIAVAALVATALALHVDLRGKFVKGLAGAAHAGFHLALVIVIVWGLAEILPSGWAGFFLWLSAVPLAWVAGYLLGSWVFACVLWLVALRGAAAPNATNEVFASQALTAWKNLVRMRLGADGRLTVFPLGVDRVWRRWDLSPTDGDGHRLSPRGGAPAARPIDDRLEFDPPAG